MRSDAERDSERWVCIDENSKLFHSGPMVGHGTILCWLLDFSVVSHVVCTPCWIGRREMTQTHMASRTKEERSIFCVVEWKESSLPVQITLKEYVCDLPNKAKLHLWSVPEWEVWWKDLRLVLLCPEQQSCVTWLITAHRGLVETLGLFIKRGLNWLWRQAQQCCL